MGQSTQNSRNVYDPLVEPFDANCFNQGINAALAVNFDYGEGETGNGYWGIDGNFGGGFSIPNPYSFDLGSNLSRHTYLHRSGSGLCEH